MMYTITNKIRLARNPTDDEGRPKHNYLVMNKLQNTDKHVIPYTRISMIMNVNGLSIQYGTSQQLIMVNSTDILRSHHGTTKTEYHPEQFEELILVQYTWSSEHHI